MHAEIGVAQATSADPGFAGKLAGASGIQSVAQDTHQAAANIMKVNRGATETGSASAEVLNSAKTLSTESTRLRDELNRFMANIRAA